MEEQPLLEDEKVNEVLGPDTDPLTNSILQYLQLKYEPTTDITTALNLTTSELFERIRAIYPMPPFDSTYLAVWLQQNGFQFVDMGDLKLVWLLKVV